MKQRVHVILFEFLIGSEEQVSKVCVLFQGTTTNYKIFSIESAFLEALSGPCEKCPPALSVHQSQLQIPMLGR